MHNRRKVNVDVSAVAFRSQLKCRHHSDDWDSWGLNHVGYSCLVIMGYIPHQ